MKTNNIFKIGFFAIAFALFSAGAWAQPNYTPFSASGTVESIGKNVLDKAYVALSNDDKADTFVSVQCFFDNNNLGDIAELAEGDNVVIVGKCQGVTFNVLLEKCDLLIG